jgi:hypothetical protein
LIDIVNVSFLQLGSKLVVGETCVMGNLDEISKPFTVPPQIRLAPVDVAEHVLEAVFDLEFIHLLVSGWITILRQGVLKDMFHDLIVELSPLD